MKKLSGGISNIAKSKATCGLILFKKLSKGFAANGLIVIALLLGAPWAQAIDQTLSQWMNNPHLSPQAGVPTIGPKQGFRFVHTGKEFEPEEITLSIKLHIVRVAIRMATIYDDANLANIPAVAELRRTVPRSLALAKAWQHDRAKLDSSPEFWESLGPALSAAVDPVKLVLTQNGTVALKAPIELLHEYFGEAGTATQEAAARAAAAQRAGGKGGSFPVHPLTPEPDESAARVARKTRLDATIQWINLIDAANSERIYQEYEAECRGPGCARERLLLDLFEAALDGIDRATSEISVLEFGRTLDRASQYYTLLAERKEDLLERQRLLTLAGLCSELERAGLEKPRYLNHFQYTVFTSQRLIETRSSLSLMEPLLELPAWLKLRPEPRSEVNSDGGGCLKQNFTSRVFANAS